MPRTTSVRSTTAASASGTTHVITSAATGPHTAHARTPAWAGLRLAVLAAAVLAAVTAGGCVKTVRTPLKQALPSVLGPETTAPLCYATPTAIDVAGAAILGSVADIDGDGRPDLALVVQGSAGDSVSFAMNDGNGGLRTTTGLKFPMQPTALEAADLNGDGLPDLAIAATPSTPADDGSAVHVLIGRGQGQFIAGAVATRVRPVGLWIADFSGDGAPDLLALDADGKQVELLVGDGRGEFKSGPRSRLPGAVAPQGLTVGDFDLDKRLDLAVLYDRGSKHEATAAIVRGDGQGGFKLAARHVVGRRGEALVAADLNTDGAADLVALAADSNGSPIAAVMLGNGNLGFTAISYFGPPEIGDVIVTDLDRNGAPDLLASTISGTSMRALLGDGRGGFGPVLDIPVGEFGQNTRAADFDGDGRPELLGFGSQAKGVGLARPQPCRK